MQATSESSACVDHASVEGLSDEKFIALSKGFAALSTFEEKVAFILSNSNTAEGIIKPLVRLINGTVYSYGFDDDYWMDTGKIAIALHNLLRNERLAALKKDLQTRLALCDSQRESELLVDEELKETAQMVRYSYAYWKNDWMAFDTGYKFERLKQSPRFTSLHLDLINCIDSNTAFYTKVSSISRGAAFYKYEVYLEDLLACKDFRLSAHPTPGRATVIGKQYRLGDFIEEKYLNWFEETEERYKTKVERWRKHAARTLNECTGFCEALFNLGWFAKVKPDQRSVNNEVIREFALWCYGVDISEALLPKRKQHREVHANRFQGQIERWIVTPRLG